MQSSLLLFDLCFSAQRAKRSEKVNVECQGCLRRLMECLRVSDLDSLAEAIKNNLMSKHLSGPVIILRILKCHLRCGFFSIFQFLNRLIFPISNNFQFSMQLREIFECFFTFTGSLSFAEALSRCLALKVNVVFPDSRVRRAR